MTYPSVIRRLLAKHATHPFPLSTAFSGLRARWLPAPQKVFSFWGVGSQISYSRPDSAYRHTPVHTHGKSVSIDTLDYSTLTHTGESRPCQAGSALACRRTHTLRGPA